MSLTPEALARTQIDQQLTAAGWAVHDVKTINLHAQLGIAVSVPSEESRHSTQETFPTTTGPADYMLFPDGKAIGIIKSKKVGETLSAVYAQATIAFNKPLLSIAMGARDPDTLSNAAKQIASNINMRGAVAHP